MREISREVKRQHPLPFFAPLREILLLNFVASFARTQVMRLARLDPALENADFTGCNPYVITWIVHD
jgi:hypothetical protein